MPPAGVPWLPTFQAPSTSISAAGLSIASMSVKIGKEAVEFGVRRDERTDAGVMACRGRRDLSFYPELAEAKEWSCHGYFQWLQCFGTMVGPKNTQ